MNEALKEELEAVESILSEEIETFEVDDEDQVEDWGLRVQLHPHTASEEEKKFVSLTLDIKFPRDYPDKVPKCKVIQ